MASRATSARPVVVAAALMVVAAVALRGYLPGAPPPPRERPADHPLSTVLVITMLVIAVAVVATAVALRARNHTPARSGHADRPDWLRGDLVKPSRRTLLIVGAVVVAAVCAGVALSGLGGWVAPDPTAVVPPRTETDDTAAPPSAAAPVAEPPGTSHDDVLGYLAAATGGFLVVLVVGSMIAARRADAPAPATRDGVERGPAAEGEAQTLARAAELGLAKVEDHGRDPRAAIIACYVAMEQELARVPEAAPRDYDTASEVLARAVDHGALRPDNATQLVDLFDEARFSTHVMNEAHRDVAADVLKLVLDELRSRT